MRKAAALLLALLMLAGCGGTKPSASAGDGEESAFPPSASVPSREENEPEMDENGFYRTVSAGEDLRSHWDVDGNFVFQNENTLITLTPDNKMLERVTFPEEQLPPGGCALIWNGSRVLAVSQKSNHSGAVYFTDDGGVYLANVTLFDRQGGLIRQYPQSQLWDEDAPGPEVVYLLPATQGTRVVGCAGLTADGFDWVYWLDDETAVFNCHSRVVLYNFATDTGRVVDDMSALVEKHGKFGVYYGVESFQCGVADGCFYYLAHRNEEKSNTVGTIGCMDKDGASELFDGKEFWHLFVGDRALVAAAHTSSEGDVLCRIDPKTLEMQEIWQGEIGLPLVENGSLIAFTGYTWKEDGPYTIAYVYDRDTGGSSGYDLGQGNSRKLLPRKVDGSLWLYYDLYQGEESADWAYDTTAGTATRLPDDSVNNILSVSPDGGHIVRSVKKQGNTWLQVSPWEF